LLLAGVRKLKVGDPLDESSDLGPLIRESDAIRAADWVQEAVRGGARLLCGGNRKGSLFEPTVLTGTKPNMKVNCQEIFAPVVTVEPYNDFASALKQINSSTLMACKPDFSPATPNSFLRPTTNSKLEA
jgi:acyl-CoA reductase-like NAD-dependent aldehyde dehydrogenase